jgi:hypothetical protein
MDRKKCDQSACSCMVEGEGFCSEGCMMSDGDYETCGCEHAACTGTTEVDLRTPRGLASHSTRG